MFCEKCGNQMADGSTVCTVCGATTAPVAPVAPAEAAPAPVAPVAQAPAGEAAAPAASSVKDQAMAYVEKVKTFAMDVWADKQKRLFAIIGGAAVLLILVLFIIFGGASKESVAEKYVKATIEGDIKAAMKYTAYDEEKALDAMLKYYMDEEDISKKEFFEDFVSEMVDEDVDSWNDLYKFYKEETKDELEDEFGDNIKITVKAMDTQEMKKKELRNALEYYEEMMEEWEDGDYEDYVKADKVFNVDKVSKGYFVTVYVGVEGEDEVEHELQTIMVVKYKGGWKVLSVDTPF